jgi:hypothetical protein
MKNSLQKLIYLLKVKLLLSKYNSNFKLAHNGWLGGSCRLRNQNYEITSGKNQIKNKFIPLRKVFATTNFQSELKC